MRIFARTFPLLLLFTTLFLASEARAEHVVITSGTVSHGNPLVFVFPSHSFNIAGNGISARGGDEKLGNGGFGPSCHPCAPGQTLAASSNITFFTTAYPGTATYNGTTYTNVLFQGTRLTFVVEPVVIPFDVTAATFNLTAAFTFDGRLVGYPFPSQTPIFDITLSGQGIATFLMRRRELPGGFSYVVDRMTYTFQSAAVPEPATLLLFSTGLAGAIASVRKRRKASE